MNALATSLEAIPAGQVGRVYVSHAQAQAILALLEPLPQEDLDALAELFALYDFMAASQFGERGGEKAARYGLALRAAIGRCQGVPRAD